MKDNGCNCSPPVRHGEARIFVRAVTRFRAAYLRRGNAPSPELPLLTLAVAAMMASPVVYVAVRAAEAGGERWLRLWNARIPQLLWSTLSLTAWVAALATVLGTALALLVERTDLPGHRYWRWLLAVPLVMPPYVGALAYIIMLGPTGWARDVLGRPPFPLYSLGGTVLVLTVFTYPYVYLTVASALRRFNRNYEEAAVSCGFTTFQALFKVVVPLLRPAIGAGAILVILYVLSDFGAVAMLRYDTFTRAVYFQMTGRFDRAGAAVLSSILIAITLAVLWLEVWTRRRGRYYQTVGTYREPLVIPLGKLKLPALLFVLVVVALSILLPLAVLSVWAADGIARGVLDARFVGYATNSLKVALPASLLAMALALPVVYLKSRYPSKFSAAADRIIFAGYALPGVIVALGIIFLFNRYLPWLYATPGMITAAYLIRFLPQSMQASEAALAQVSPRLDEAARGLGTPTGRVLWGVILPLILPGVLAGGALVFVSALKELPATLLLRPAGFDTLAVRVWLQAHEGFYAEASVPALLMVLVSLLPLKLLLDKY